MNKIDRYRNKCVMEFAEHYNIRPSNVEILFRDYGINEIIYNHYDKLIQIEEVEPLWSYFGNVIRDTRHPELDLFLYGH